MDPEQIPLRDLHLPGEIGWWPMAPGWWFVLAVLAVAAGIQVWRWIQAWRANRARRIALRELGWIAREFDLKGDAVQLAGDLSELLRRALLAYAPRHVVAGLTGDAWLAWLDQGMAQPLFTAGAGRHVASLPYRNPETGLAAAEAKALIEAVRRRLETPLTEAAA